MPDETTYKVETSGSGSSFEAMVRAYPAGAGKYDPNPVVAKETGFRDRNAAAKWGRAKIRELRGLPPSGPRAAVRSCKTCLHRLGGTRWEAGECVYPLPPFPLLPESITTGGFDPARLTRMGVWPDGEDGRTCPTWAERPKG